jgi:uncharacterized protein with PIN domain
MRKGHDKKRAYAAMEDIANTAKSIAEEMKETNRLARETDKERKRIILAKQKSRLAQQSQLIALAVHLGKQEILEQMLENVASSFDD